jgi:arabinose-5-phosphate isomerase
MGAIPQMKTQNSDSDLIAGRDVLLLERDALNALADSLDERFTAALDIIVALKGRLIVSGMGKAGHIGKKITATLASTGTPCYFVHPAEASHGDLGMIGEDDAVLMLSNSGETKELGDLINYCKRFSIPLIAVTSKKDSTMGRQADIVLELPAVAEACPNQQAPTTSTTMILGMGDALAIALMKRRGFSAVDFKTYHPGGKLGGQLLAVKVIMKQGDELPLVSMDAIMSDAQKIISDKKFGCAIIVNDKNELQGFMTDGDIRRHLSADLLQKKVTEVMNATPRSIDSEALAAEALAIMNQLSITQLLVVNGKQPVGLVRLNDIMRAGVA